MTTGVSFPFFKVLSKNLLFGFCLQDFSKEKSGYWNGENGGRVVGRATAKMVPLLYG